MEEKKKFGIDSMGSLTGEKITEVPDNYNPLYILALKVSKELENFNDFNLEERYQVLSSLKDNMDMQEFYANPPELMDVLSRLEKKSTNDVAVLELFSKIMSYYDDENVIVVNKKLEDKYEENPELFNSMTTQKQKAKYQKEQRPTLKMKPTEEKPKNKMKLSMN